MSRHPAIFTLSIGVDSVTDARDWAQCDKDFYRRLAEAALERGVIFDPDPREPWCLCYCHSDQDIDETLDVMQDAMRAVKP